MLKSLFRPSSKGRRDGATSTAGDVSYAVDLRSVVKQFQTAAGIFTALKTVDFHVNRGEFVGVIGKSGSGKSTLINMITGIDRPTSGEVFVAGTPVHTLNEGQMAVWRGRNLGIVFQFFQLLPTLSLADNIMLPMDFCGTYHASERYDRAIELLDLVGMADQAQKLPSAISGGQQQRVAIARALANDPPILIADEPTGNLDSRTADSVFELFESLISEGKTILMVTHDNDLAKRVTRTIILSDGEIIEQYLAKTFPALDEDQLIWATRRLQARRVRAWRPDHQSRRAAGQLLRHHPRQGRGVHHGALRTGAPGRVDAGRPVLRRGRAACRRHPHRDCAGRSRHRCRRRRRSMRRPSAR